VVRGSLEVGEQVRNLLHRGNGGRPTTQEPAGRGGDGRLLLGRIIVSRVVVDRQQLVARRLIRRRRRRFLDDFNLI
jgi:hypothetical protein